MPLFSFVLQEGTQLKSKGKAGAATRVAVLTWRSLLVMSREWKYYWLRLILYMILTLCIGTLYSGLGHSLSSVAVSLLKTILNMSSIKICNLSFEVNVSLQTRVAAVFVFVSFASLLGIAGIPSLLKEIKVTISSS